MPDGTISTSLNQVKISELPVAGAVNDTDQLEANQTGTSRSVTLAQIKTAAVAAVPLAYAVNVKTFGAKGDGVSDDTAAIQAALNTGHAIFLPRGNYLVKDMLTVPYGSGIFGETKQYSKIIVPVTFNLSAAGVISLTAPSVFGNEQAATIKGISIEFDQPDTAVRASLVQYPPAIYSRNAPRIVVDNVRIVRGWSGIWMDSVTPTGSTGGCWIDCFEASCFSRSIYMEDCLDVQHVSRVHLWTFGLTANQLTAFKDGNTIGLEAGRTDTLHITDFFAIYMPKGIYLRTGTRNWPGLNFGQFNVVLDDAGLVIANGTWNISNLYIAPGPVTARSLIVQPDGAVGCAVTISSLLQRILSVHSSGQAETIYVASNVANTRVTIASVISLGAAFDRTHILCQNVAGGAAELIINAGHFDRAGNSSPTNPSIWIKSGRAALNNIYAPDKGTGTGNLIQVDADDWITLSNVYGLGWGVSLPAGASLIEHTVYPVRQTYTPTVTASVGTLTSYTATGRYTRRGKFLKLQLTITITTNGTAATGLVATLPAGFTSAGANQIIGREAAATGSALQGTIVNAASAILIQTYNNLYPGGNGYILNLNGEIEVQ